MNFDVVLLNGACAILAAAWLWQEKRIAKINRTISQLEKLHKPRIVKDAKPQDSTRKTPKIIDDQTAARIEQQARRRNEAYRGWSD